MIRNTISKSSVRVNRVPFGYRRISKEIIIPDGKVWPILQIALISVSFGMSIRSALIQATEAGLRNQQGKELSLSSFRLIVNNPFYAGYIRINGKEYRGNYEPIITKYTFRKIQKVLRHYQCRRIKLDRLEKSLNQIS